MLSQNTSELMRQIGWVAGFLEGEGCFHITKNKTIYISANQVQKEPLERLQSYFGGSLYYYSVKDKPGRNPIWTWHLGRRDAIGIMMMIYPLMSPKRKERIKDILIKWRKYAGLAWRADRIIRCPHGHLYEGDNLIVAKYKNVTRRFCRTCVNKRAKERARRLAAQKRGEAYVTSSG